MNYFVYILLLGGAYCLYRKFTEEPHYEKYIEIDLPPIKVPASMGNKESVYKKFIPKIKPVYASIPPKIRIIWDRIAIGAWSFEVPEKIYTLPRGYSRSAVNAVVRSIRTKLISTKVYKSNGFWVIDFPAIKIPT